MIWATVSSWSCFCWLYRASPSLAAKNIINLTSVLTILVMSMCRVFSCVVGRGCLLWPVHFLGKTLVVFALLHSTSKAKFACYSRCFLTSPVAQTVKHLPTMWETWVRSLGWEDPLEKEMATHSSILAWRTPGRRSLVGYSPRGRKESDTTERLHFTLLHGNYRKPMCSNEDLSQPINKKKSENLL